MLEVLFPNALSTLLCCLFNRLIASNSTAPFSLPDLSVFQLVGSELLVSYPVTAEETHCSPTDRPELISTEAPMSTRNLRSKATGEASINQSPGPNVLDEAGEWSHETAAFEVRAISRYVPAAKICAILFLALLALPQKIDSSNPEAFLWIIPGYLLVWPLWIATIIACAVIFFIGGRGYDSFFASCYVYDHDFSSWIRTRTSTNPARENRRHAIIMGIYITAACLIAVQCVAFSGLFFANLGVLDEAIKEGNPQAQKQLSWLTHPVLRFALAGLPAIFCRTLIKKGANLYHIGTEARTDRIEDELARMRYNELRLRTPLMQVEDKTGHIGVVQEASEKDTQILVDSNVR